MGQLRDARSTIQTRGGVDCELCGMHLNSLKQWEDHRTGKKHVKKMKNPTNKLTCDVLALPAAATGAPASTPSEGWTA